MTTRLALVGLGYWGPNLARVIADSPAAELAVLCEADTSRLSRFATRYPGANATSDYEAVLADPSIDAVVLATPAETHHPLALAALRAGKHVLVEKPLALTVGDAEQLAAAARDNSLVLMPGHVFLYNSAVRYVATLISSGALGEVYYAYSQRLNLGQIRRDVNALWNFAPHDVSILNYWLQASPVRVVARGFSYVQSDIEDVVFMTLEYPGGVGANVHLSWLDPHKTRMMTVVGSEKMVVYDDTSPDARIRIYDKGIDRKAVGGSGQGLERFETFAEFQLLLRAGDVLIPKIDFPEPLQLELDDFVGAIREGRSPVSSAEVGVEVVRSLVAAQASIEGAGSPVAV